jgi:hypothetical protein
MISWLRSHPRPPRTTQAFRSVPRSLLESRRCEGCEQPFTPARRSARHCRPSCRKLSLERRRAKPLLDADDDPLCRDGFE